MRSSGRLLLISLLYSTLLAFVATSPLLSQLTTETQPAASVPKPIVPEARASARSTMKTFLEAFYSEDDSLRSAIECLDLSGISQTLRATQGREYATQLKSILDHTRLVKLETIPDSPEGPAYVFLKNANGSVVIDLMESGEWLFTTETLAALPELTRALENSAIAEGVERTVDLEMSPGLWLRARMPEALRHRTFLLEHWQWLALFLLVMVGVIFDRVVTFSLRIMLSTRLRKSLVAVDEEVLVSGVRPLGLVAMSLVWWFSLRWLALPIGVSQMLSVAAEFVLTFSVVWATYRLVDIVAEVLGQRAAVSDSKLDDLLVPLVRKTLKVFVAAFGLVFIAGNLDIDVSSLLAGLGLGGIAFALAAQDTVKNLFGSLTILVDRPFAVGDWVQIGTVEGTVEEVGIRSTRVRTFYNSQITVPNANLISANVDNFGARQYRRWKTMLAITYDTAPEKVEAFCEGIRELVRRHPYTRKDYYEVHFNGFGPSSLDIMLYMFFVTPDWSTELRERHRLGLDILRLAEQLGVEFAFPTQSLHIRQDSAPLEPSNMDGYGQMAESSKTVGRDTARELLDASLGGRIPPPVGSDQHGESV